MFKNDIAISIVSNNNISITEISLLVLFMYSIFLEKKVNASCYIFFYFIKKIINSLNCSLCSIERNNSEFYNRIERYYAHGKNKNSRTLNQRCSIKNLI